MSRAAHRLAIAQPPLSQQIRRLERELGYPLFERTPTGVVPTRAGEALLPHARALLRAADGAVATAAAAHRGDAGRLTLGFINGAAYRVLPTLLRRYRARHPDVTVIVREMAISEQLEALAEGHIDAGILRPEIDEAQFASLLLSREPFVAAVPADDPRATQASIALRDLDGRALVAYPRGHPAGFRERIDAALHAAGAAPSIVQEATQLHTLCGLAAGGVGIAIVPEDARALAIAGLRFVPLDGLHACAETCLAWRRSNTLAQLGNLVAVADSTSKAAAVGTTNA